MGLVNQKVIDESYVGQNCYCKFPDLHNLAPIDSITGCLFAIPS
jgi:hypothetical protein